MMLTHKGLWDAADGTETDAVMYKKVLALIALSAKDFQIACIQECTTGNAAQKMLAALYENSGVANQMALIEVVMIPKMEYESK